MKKTNLHTGDSLFIHRSLTVSSGVALVLGWSSAWDMAEVPIEIDADR
jgi:hypothetical protein